jgi:geranylgeranyl diphosphate synthase type I
VSERNSLLELIQQEIDSFCDDKREQLSEISDDLMPIIDYTQELLQGGKRFRALFAYWAWAAALPRESDPGELIDQANGIVGISSALEIFHAAALVHDDLMDQSDTRRGKPAIHKRFEHMHSEKGFLGDPERFGQSGSVLVGDLMLNWSSEVFGAAVTSAPNAEIETSCRNEFSKMRFEVMAGQYLDVLEENAAPLRSLADAVTKAEKVMLYKTAKYSLEAPLLIGASFAGADEQTLSGFSNFGIPLGMAFQIRDDILGVFGDPEITGKPAGDDLREGKRTVLVALTLQNSSTSIARIFNDLLSERDLETEQIQFMQQTIRDSGALEKTERMMQEYGDRALEVLKNLDLEPQAKQKLQDLAEKVISRTS